MHSAVWRGVPRYCFARPFGLVFDFYNSGRIIEKTHDIVVGDTILI